jgi:phosphoenolpyruvate carboxykinase (ATP)
MSEDLGVRNPSAGIDLCGLNTSGLVRYNCLEAELVELAVARGEAILTAHGALRALTGQHTGRSAKDKFVVRDANTDSQIWWDNNKPMTPEAFDTLHADMLAHAKELDLFVQDLVGGADEDNALNSRVITEYAWHALFIRNLLIRPDRADLTGFMPELTIINLPSFRADPARHGCRTDTVIAVDLERRLVLIGGTSYAGEMKKSVFTALNYLLPAKGVMPMHCSANDGPMATPPCSSAFREPARPRFRPIRNAR